MSTTSQLSYAATGAFSGLVLDYINQASALTEFYGRPPTLAAFGEQIAEKKASYDTASRQRLVAALRDQYLSIGGAPPRVAASIQLLERDTTFSVTTGHQLALFTGPLYFIYKIISAIRLCRDLKAAHPENDFVPVFWLASEDHDFAEINHFHLFGKKYEWQAESPGGPVGRLPLTGLEAQVLSQLPAEVPAAFLAAYRESKTLGEATRRLVNALFGEYGLVCLDADRADLKQALVPVLEREILTQTSNHAVQATNALLEMAGYKPQVYSRPLNLFFLAETGQRERLEVDAAGPDGAQIAGRGAGPGHSRPELLALARQHPARFSPNVVLRPVYQELLLPNVCYIGGGAEVAYWGQLKDVFAANEVVFPMVLLRNSALYLSRANAAKLRKLGLETADLFKPLPELKKRVGTLLGQEEVSLSEAQAQLQAAFDQVAALAQRLDPTLVKAVAAEAQKAAAAVTGLEKRLSRAAEARHETAYAQLTALHAKLFPDGGLQERTDNVLSILLNNPAFLEQLLEAFSPLALTFTVLEEA